MMLVPEEKKHTLILLRGMSYLHAFPMNAEVPAVAMPAGIVHIIGRM
jgi:hypothetical protein